MNFKTYKDFSRDSASWPCSVMIFVIAIDILRIRIKNKHDLKGLEM